MSDDSVESFWRAAARGTKLCDLNSAMAREHMVPLLEEYVRAREAAVAKAATEKERKQFRVFVLGLAERIDALVDAVNGLDAFLDDATRTTDWIDP